MASNFSNIAKPLYLRGALNNTDAQSVIQVSSMIAGVQEDGAAYGWPVPPFFLIIDSNNVNEEVVKVISKTGSGGSTEYIVTRGSSLDLERYGSTTVGHNAWSIVEPIWSAADATNASAAADILFGGKTILNAVASNVPLTIKGAQSQSANSFSVKTSTDSEVFAITSAGNVTLSKIYPVFKINSTLGASTLYINGPSQVHRMITLNTLDETRWTISANTAVESGGDAGSNFEIVRYTDVGGPLGTPLTINRATGETTLTSLNVTGAATFSSNILSSTAPSSGSHLTNKTYVDAQDALKLNLTGGTLSGALIGTSGTFSGTVQGATVTATGSVSGNNATFTNAISVGTPTIAAHATTKTYVDDADALKVDIAGTQTITGAKTFTSDITITKDWPVTYFNGSKSGSTVKGGGIWWQAGGTTRWYMKQTDDAETGSNAGSNLAIVGYDDSGNSLVNPISITRATGKIDFGGNLENSGSGSRYLAVQSTNNQGSLYVSGANTYVAQIELRTSGTARWKIRKNAATESGSDVGSDFIIQSQGDDNTVRDRFGINRATGKITISGPLEVAGQTAGSGIYSQIDGLRIINNSTGWRYLSTPGDNLKIFAGTHDSTSRIILPYNNTHVTIENGILITASSTTSRASLRIPHGTAPDSPTNGDVWTTTGNIFARINSATIPVGSVATEITSSGTTIDLNATYVGTVLTTTSSSNITINMPSTNPIVGAMITVIQMGTGQVTFAANGKTLNGTPGLKLRAQYSSATLWQRSAGVWVVMGDLIA